MNAADPPDSPDSPDSAGAPDPSDAPDPADPSPLPLDPAPVDGGEVTLRARFGAPLADTGVRDVVASTAVAIGERHGVVVRVLDIDDTSVRLHVAGGDLVAIGLAAELRRLTDRWHHHRFGAPLWRAPWEPDHAG